MANNNTNNLSAEMIVSSYGKILANASPTFYGLPFTDLPFSIIQIKDAIQKLITTNQSDNEDVLQSLIQSYISLAQFVTNDELEILSNGMAAIDNKKPSEDDYIAMEQASFVTSKIKAEMENNTEELQLLLGSKIQLG